MFFEENAKLLQEFSRLSQAAGARADYIQGGGGNTSVKLENGLMAIKASGYFLSDILPDKGYAVLDAAAVRKFYLDNEPDQLEDVEKQGSDCAKENVQTIPGLEAVRPSVEAGFHSILNTFVLHTHSVYANLAACSTSCRQIAKIAFADAPYTWGWVAYTDPGANLTFAIRDELRRVEAETGKTPAVILMQNHGIIVHHQDADRCLAIHSDANQRLARHFGLTGEDFPEICIAEESDGSYTATTEYLKEQLRSGRHTQKSLMEEPLYPDQMVFLADTFFMDADTMEDGQGIANSQTGQVRMRMPQKKAQTLTEILVAVCFITEHIEKNGYALSTMGEAAKAFIANWESEKYRKSLVETKR
ncbi:MAG: class II aldolase/adducin family protein [Oscillospiraceae bacterium]|nr:class II aldolase/adducin family protein [Oscillospiraceae bacterium]